MIENLILGSGSKWRANLLKSAGIKVSCIPPQLDESLIQGDTPIDLAMNRAKAKAMSVSQSHPYSYVIGCDQVLEFEGKPYGKAKNREQAKRRLIEFSGCTHQLHSAYTITKNTGEGIEVIDHSVVTASLTMKALSEQDIDRYLDTGEWQGCAGCYQFENEGGKLFSNVVGDESTIIGLPIKELLLTLSKI